jgi:NAD(P)-dependent dehydrogenase (short-subunit alcohol dehydrogenase family)
LLRRNQPLTKNLALEFAPIHVNLIAAGFVDTPLSASLLGDQPERVASNLEERCRSGVWSARPTSPHWPFTS